MRILIALQADTLCRRARPDHFAACCTQARVSPGCNRSLGPSDAGGSAIGLSATDAAPKHFDFQVGRVPFPFGRLAHAKTGLFLVKARKSHRRRSYSPGLNKELIDDQIVRISQDRGVLTAMSIELGFAELSRCENPWLGDIQQPQSVRPARIADLQRSDMHFHLDVAGTCVPQQPRQGPAGGSFAVRWPDRLAEGLVQNAP
jgi:hypothetical protein